MNKLAEIRKQKGLTQTELAEKCGITQRMITRFETGERKLTTAQATTVLTIAHALETTVEELIAE